MAFPFNNQQTQREDFKSDCRGGCLEGGSVTSHMCIMEASSFYGPPPKSDEVATSKRRLRLERAALMVGTTNNFWRGKRLLPTFPDDVHVFSTQKAAIEHAKEPRNEQRGLMVFALEVNADGKRSVGRVKIDRNGSRPCIRQPLQLIRVKRSLDLRSKS